MDNNYLKVEGYSNLVRDPNTNAILNTDNRGYNYYVNARNSKRHELNRIDRIESNLGNFKSDLDELKSSIDDIKILLRKIANGWS